MLVLKKSLFQYFQNQAFLTKLVNDERADGRKQRKIYRPLFIFFILTHKSE